MTGEMLNFSGKSLFVAGGTSGINLGIALNFARAGARVAVMSRAQDKVDAAVKEIAAAGAPKAVGYAADVRDYPAVDTAMKNAAELIGDFDILVSGAAGNFPAPAMGMSPNAFKSVVDIDLLGSYHVLRAAFPFLKKPGASVINISAPQAFIPMQFQAHVCAAKAGVDMLTRTLALEWGGMGIRVNSICPGPIADTEGMRRLAPTPESERATLKSVPLKRMGTVDDIGRAALFLASPLADYISGVILPVDGGWALGGAAALAGSLGGLGK